jgi:hypothetical protein
MKQLVLAIVFTVTGCAEDELVRRVERMGRAVQLASHEPDAACRALTAVAVRSGRQDATTSDTLRDLALATGANYVVFDTFTVDDDDTDTTVLTRARLFCCPASVRLSE